MRGHLRTPEEPRALLKLPRAVARQRLLERIQQGRQLIADPIQTGEQFTKIEREHEGWRAYNRELLTRQHFTTDEYADEYRDSFKLIHRARDRYDTPSLAALAARLSYSVNNQIACLESIIERLELIDEASVDGNSVAVPGDRSRVFVIHGHDEGALQGVARFLEKIELKAIVLREQPDQGRATIEKFEACAREVGFAVVLLTPDDVGGAVAAEQSARARQNVIFELGYFVGALGRGRACLLRKGKVEIPSDLFGVVYTDFDHPAEGWKIKLGRELKAAGFQFDADKVLA